MGCVNLGEKNCVHLQWVNKTQINYPISRNLWEVLILGPVDLPSSDPVQVSEVRAVPEEPRSARDHREDGGGRGRALREDATLHRRERQVAATTAA